MALFRKKRAFHFELDEAENVQVTFIEDFNHLCDWLEEENERLKECHEEGSVVIYKKDEQETIFSKVVVAFPFENPSEELIVPLVEQQKKAVQNEKKQASKKEEILFDVPKREKELATQEKQKKREERQKSSFIKPLKMAFVLGLMSTVIVLGSLFLPGLLKPSYADLIQQEDYVKAYELYPEEQMAIEGLLFDKGQQGIRQLEAYVSKTDSKSATFDLAYLQQDFHKVVSLKEEATTPIKKTALAVSYVKVGDVDSAFALNESLKSSKLKELIISAYEVQAVDSLKSLDVAKAEEIQHKIQQATLQAKIEHVSSALSEEKQLKEKLSDSSLDSGQKEETEKQLKQVQEKIERIKKGVF